MKSRSYDFNISIRDNVFSQGSGLMFSFPKKPFAYIFPFKAPVKTPITMWFVFYPIDLVFIDSSGLVVELVVGIKPFSNYFPKSYFSTLLEFPKGTISSHHIRLGSHISWSSNSITIKNS